MKLTNIIAIGILIISAIIAIKMKPVYSVSIDGTQVGYIKDKNKFEEFVEEQFNNNEENNIAFVDLLKEPTYEFKLVSNQEEINENKVLIAMKENADITYFQYAIYANGSEKERVTTQKEAQEIVNALKEEFEDQIEISMDRVYTKDLEILSEVQVASLQTQLITQVKEQILEEEKIEKATINGVYLSVNPIQGHITSRYGAREAIRDHTHKGLDIAAKTGTPIKAVSDGRIQFAGTMGGYGNLIIIHHGNGITTYYGHCSKLYKKVGNEVTAGEVIAAVGNTGNSTGSHLHFEIRKNGIYTNPLKYLYQ